MAVELQGIRDELVSRRRRVVDEAERAKVELVACLATVAHLDASIALIDDAAAHEGITLVDDVDTAGLGE
jgi:hypothetical protein